MKEITYPSGSVIVGMRYTLDDLGRPTTIERKLSTAVEGISSSAWETAATVKYAGHREGERVQAPYDLKRTQSWTNFKEPADLEYKKNSSPYTLLTGLSSQWNADGQMVVRERMHDEAGGYEWGEVFRYDRMGRLTKMWYDVRNPSGFASTDPVEGTNPYDLRKSWNLGKVYERDSVVVKEYNQTASTTTYSVNDHYQVTAGPGAMTWNDNGYMTDRAADDFSWTALGQLEQAAISGGSTLDYTYDAFGRRVKTVNGSQVNRFLYHGWHMIGEWDDTAEEWLWQEAPWNSGERMLEHIALDTNDLDTDENVNEYRQYAVHEDFQDTVWGLSGTDAAIAERYNYTDPYGQSDSEDGTASALGDFATQVFHRRRLHGGIVESGSELYDFRNRWQTASLGAFLSRDPMMYGDSENPYQFSLAAPCYISDQSGQRCSSVNNCDTECSPHECPCRTWRDTIKGAMKDGVNHARQTGLISGAEYDKAMAMVLVLERTSVYCGPCGQFKCAYSQYGGPGGHHRIQICYHFKRQPTGGTGPNPSRAPCEPCCDCTCWDLLAHEWLHLGCQEITPGRDCDHTGPEGPAWTDCGVAIVECFINPTQACLAAAKSCYKQVTK